MVRHKHHWENVLEVLSTDKNDNLHIELCDECRAVRVDWETTKRTVIVYKEKRQKKIPPNQRN